MVETAQLQELAAGRCMFCSQDYVGPISNGFSASAEIKMASFESSGGVCASTGRNLVLQLLHEKVMSYSVVLETQRKARGTGFFLVAKC